MRLLVTGAEAGVNLIRNKEETFLILMKSIILMFLL